MSNAYQEDISSALLQKMKDGGFDFAAIHPIEFYAVFPDENGARAAAGQFQGESLNAQVMEREDGAWHLELSKLMYATRFGIGEFEHDFETTVEPFGGEIEGWGVKHRLTRPHA